MRPGRLEAARPRSWCSPSSTDKPLMQPDREAISGKGTAPPVLAGLFSWVTRSVAQIRRLRARDRPAVGDRQGRCLVAARGDVSLRCVGAVVAHRPREGASRELCRRVRRRHRLRGGSGYAGRGAVDRTARAVARGIERERHRAGQVAASRRADGHRVVRDPLLGARQRRCDTRDADVLIGIGACGVVRDAVGVRELPLYTATQW